MEMMTLVLKAGNPTTAQMTKRTIIKKAGKQRPIQKVKRNLATSRLDGNRRDGATSQERNPRRRN